MRASSSKRLAAIIVSAILVGCGGGGDGGGVSVLPPAALFISPTAVNFGAIGSTKQVTTQYKDANGVVVTGTGVTFVLSGTGASATVSASGLVTAVALGAGVDTVVATGNGLTAKAPIFVTQIPASITVTSTSLTPDTLFAATRTRQFSATVKDTNNNVIASPGSIAWTTNNAGVATVGASTGLVAAVGDGSTTIQAAAGAANGTRAIVVRRLVAGAHSVTPPTGTISVAGGAAGPFSASVLDSAGQSIPVTWTSRSTSVFTVNSPSAASTNVTATGNGSAYLIVNVPSFTAVDSAAITVSGQPIIPTTAQVTIGDDFFKSNHNGSTQPGDAVDTIAVNGSVTWTWTGTVSHSVQSLGSPSFTSSTIKSSGTYTTSFNAVGTYTYNCAVHGNAMTGRIVVR